MNAFINLRRFSVSHLKYSKILNNSKNKSKSSKDWLERQLKDPYVEKAKMSSYRCRSAFKLLQMNEKANILHPGQVVVDIGAAPGSWSQVAVQKTNADGHDTSAAKGTVVSIDILQIYPIQGAVVIGNTDFTTDEAQEKLKAALNGKKVDVVMSDMAPNATGIREMDQDRIINLCYRVLRFAAQVSKVNASLLVKVWDGGEVPVYHLDLERFYDSVKIMKPDASRADSAEKFFLARGFKGLLSREH